MFDFEKRLAIQMKIKNKNFIKLGYFCYLRTIMMERWTILNKSHTYPRMLKPLKVFVKSISCIE